MTAVAVMATATVAKPAKVALKAKAATNPVAKFAAHAVKAVVTDAITAVDAVVVAPAAEIAKAARSASGLTPKASPFPWMPIYNLAARPKAALTPIARSPVPNAVRALTGVSAAVAAVVANATKRVNAASRRVQKSAPMPW